MKNIKTKFLLNDDITYLNHGSFGACPKPIFKDYQHWQFQLENEPVNFITHTGLIQLKKSKEKLANYIGCVADDFVFTTNPSYAINIIAKSLKLNKGDEILSTNHEYGAMVRTWNYYCKKAGAKFVQQEIKLPVLSKEKIIEQFFKGLTSKTKVIFLSHITSSTALIFPVKEIIAQAKKKKLLTIVDGAHVPGHIPLNLKELVADIYTGACHKWLLTPKGSSFLYVRKELQNLFDPLIISWGYESENPSHSQFLDYHEYQGTRDFSAFLTLPKALQFFKKNDWKAKSEDCKKLVLKYYPILCDILDTKPICPLSPHFLGQMCSIPIKAKNVLELKNKLFNDYKIEIPITQMGDKTFLRLSIQAYNTEKDIKKLISALIKIK